MTFSQYIISVRTRKFYLNALVQIAKCDSTVEEWFKDLYEEYQLIQKLVID